MKTTKRVITMLLVLAMLLPSAIFAANEGVSREQIENGILIDLFTSGESYSTPSSVKEINPVGKLGVIRAKNLKRIDIGSGVKSIGVSAFQYKRDDLPSLETVTMKDIETIGPNAFKNQVNLKNVTLSKNLKEIGWGAFIGCTSLEEIILPEGLEIIGQQAFEGCTGLKRIEIPGTVKKLEPYLFSGNTGLIEVVVHEGVEAIDGEVFGAAPNIEKLYLPTTIKHIERNAFHSGIFRTAGRVQIYAAKGSYAEKYARENGIGFVATNETGTAPTVPEQPTQPIADSNATTPTLPATPTVSIKPTESGLPNVWFEERYVVPPGKVEKKELKFELWTSIYDSGIKVTGGYNEDYNWIGTYDIETWSRDTKLEFIQNEDANFDIVSTGFYWVNKENELESNVGGITATEVNAFIIDDNTSRSTPVGKDKMKTSTIERNDMFEYYWYGNPRRFTDKDDDVFLYILTRYVPEGMVITEENFYGTYKLRFIKFDNSQAPTQPALPHKVTATPTTSKVLINGKVVNLDVYVINGNNYFKLRDMATLVSGTTKQFEVGWNQAARVIDLISNRPYTKQGGELVKGDGELEKGDGKVMQGSLNTSKIYKDGQEVKLTAYTINGNNYFKLRDLAAAFDIGVTWDNATSTVGIDTSIGYTSE